jgi:hypothetical protein
MPVPTEEEWGDYQADLDQEYAHDLFAGIVDAKRAIRRIARDPREIPMQGLILEMGKNTIEETDKRHGKVISIARMTLAADGKKPCTLVVAAGHSQVAVPPRS